MSNVVRLPVLDAVTRERMRELREAKVAELRNFADQLEASEDAHALTVPASGVVAFALVAVTHTPCPEVRGAVQSDPLTISYRNAAACEWPESSQMANGLLAEAQSQLHQWAADSDAMAEVLQDYEDGQ